MAAMVSESKKRRPVPMPGQGGVYITGLSLPARQEAMELVGQGGICFQAQPFSTNGGVQAAGGHSGGNGAFVQLAAENGAETIDQGLSPLGKAGTDHSEQKGLAADGSHWRGSAHPTAEDRRNNLWRRVKAGRRYIEKDLRLRVVLHIEGESTVILCTGGSGNP